MNVTEAILNLIERYKALIHLHDPKAFPTKLKLLEINAHSLRTRNNLTLHHCLQKVYQDLQLIHRETISPIRNKKIVALIKAMELFFANHYLEEGEVVNVGQKTSGILMEMIQILHFCQGVVSSEKEQWILNKIDFLLMKGDEEQFALCKKLFTQKKALLRPKIHQLLLKKINRQIILAKKVSGKEDSSEFPVKTLP